MKATSVFQIWLIIPAVVLGITSVAHGAYDPMPGATLDNPYFFTGRITDTLHADALLAEGEGSDPDGVRRIQDNRNRTYDPKHGRWLQRDPLGVKVTAIAGIEPQQQYTEGMNLYEYSNSKPSTQTDSFGLYGDCTPDYVKFDDLMKGTARWIKGQWYYLYGSGETLVRDSWASDIKTMDTYYDVVYNLKAKVRATGLRKLFAIGPNETVKGHVNDATLLSFTDKYSLAPLGRFYVWSLASCEFTCDFSTPGCSRYGALKYKCSVHYTVKDPFDYPVVRTLMALWFKRGTAFAELMVRKLKGQEDAIENAQNVHPFLYTIDWTGQLKGRACFPAGSDDPVTGYDMR